MTSSDSSQAYLTSRGVSSPLKDALLARFPYVRAAFNQTAFIESLNLPHQVLADIWLPVGFPPVSFEPLGEEEEKVAVSGQFSNTNVRSRNNSNYNSASTGEYHRGNRSNNPRGGGQNRSRGGSFVTAASGRTSENQPRNFRQTFEKEDEDVIEDPDNLWATPSSDTFGSSDFGTFDENGMFRAGGNLNTMGALEDFASSSAAFEGFMQTRPHHVNVPVNQSVSQSVSTAQNVPAAPLSPPVAIPHITPDTQWLYRDPSGQIQGPFPSHRMMEWYNGKYFPENLPLRREQDHFFEPLSTWKTKCAGQIPFVAYTVAKAPEPPVSLGFGNRTSVPVSQWFNESSGENRETTNVREANNVRETSVTTESVAPATTTSTRSVPIESLFSLPATKPQPEAVAATTAAPEVTMPSVAAGWKKLEKPSISTKFGQLDLNETSVPEPTKTLEPEPAKVIQPIVSESVEPVKPATPLATAASSWSNSSASNGSLKKISLSEILKSTAPATPEEPVVKAQSPAPTPQNAAGWAKLSASPVQSLSSIQAEEAARQRVASVSSSSSSASKSFADLVRSAGVITSGNIVVSPTVSDRLPLEASAIRSHSLTSASSVSTAAVKPKASVPTSTVSKPEPATVKTSVPSIPATDSIEDWCLTSLKQSPSLSKSIDPQTCTILLLDLPNPSALLTFALETLKPLEIGAFDLAFFAQELSVRKFGQKETEKVQWSKLKTVPQQKKQEESFEVVKRKK